MKKGNEKKEQKSKILDSFKEGKTIMIAENKPPFKPIRRYRWRGKLSEIKKDAAEIIGLNTKIGRIFTTDGTVINSIDQVNDGDVVVAVKAGDEFKQEKEKIKFSKPKSHRASEEVVVLAERIKAEQKKTPIIMKETQIDKLNYYIAMSKTPIKVAHQLAMLSTFANFDKNVQNEIKNKNDFVNEIIAVQQQYFYKQLVDQGIAPPRAGIPFQEELRQWAATCVEKVDFDKVKFAIYGQRFSGKTMVLNSIATTYYRKLALAGINGTFLPFPIDFALNNVLLDDEVQAYQLFVRISFESVRYSCPQILPIYDFLLNWFKGLTDTLSPKPLSPAVKEIKGINEKKLKEMGRSLVSAFTFKETTKSSRKTTRRSVIYEAITSFPCDLCEAVGLKQPIFIIDHADQCNEDMAKALISVLDDNLYIMASQVDSEFFSTFQLKQATPLYSDSIIKEEPTHRMLLVDSGTFLSEKDCSGCPGYLSAFYDICNLVLEYKKLPAAKKFRKFKTAADVSREMEVKKKIILFLDILKESGNKKITSTLLEDLSEQKSAVRIEVTVEEKPKPKEPEPEPEPTQEPADNEETRTNSSVANNPTSTNPQISTQIDDNIDN